MEEIWKALPEYDGVYEVSNTGKVRSLRYNKQLFSKELSYRVNSRGFVVVTIKGNKTLFVHKAVGLAFLNTDSLYHIDGDKLNNNLDNLRIKVEKN